MSRSYTSSPPQVPPWRVAGLLLHFSDVLYQGTQAFIAEMLCHENVWGREGPSLRILVFGTRPM
jgi:hypothetical protein